MSRRSCVRMLLLLSLACPIELSLQSDLVAQTSSRLFPAREMMPRLLGAPREPVTGAKFVWNNESPNEYGVGFDGEVAFGGTLPLYLLSGSDVQDALVIGVEAGVFGRFTLENNARELITTDWVFAVPVTVRRGGDWYQFRYHHLSGHLGDEYSARFDATAENFGRDALELTAFRRVAPGLGVYGGINWSYNVHPDNAERFILRTGLQVETPSDDGPILPYGAVDVQWEQDNAWEPRMNVQIGLRLPELEGRRLVRVAAEFFVGPSAQGQFHDEHVRQVTFGVYVDP